MCVANSARSQMAEGIAKTLYPNIEFKSAGSIPSKVNPLAIQVMEEINIDITDHFSKDFESMDKYYIDNLVIKEAYCGKQIIMKSFRARAKGRASPIMKPYSNVTIILTEKVQQKENHGSKS